jgi:hypothetical protein
MNMNARNKSRCGKHRKRLALAFLNSMERWHFATTQPEYRRGKCESHDLQTKDNRKKNPYTQAQDFLDDSE